MTDETELLPRPEGEGPFRPHPWVPGDTPEKLAEELSAPCRLAWACREFHTNTLDFVRESAGPTGSPREIEEKLAADPGATEALRRSLDCFSAAATDHLASAAHLIWAGGYLFSLPTVIRSSIENSIAGCWLLNPSLTPAQRAQRAHIVRYNDISRFIEEAPSAVARKAKASRRTYRGELTESYPEGQITFDSNGRLVSLGETDRPTFASQFEETSKRLDLGSTLETHYGVLSQMAHPNPASAEFFYHRDGGYHREPGDTRHLVWVGVASYAQFVRHLTSYFGPQREAQARFEEMVASAFPHFFAD